MRKQIAELIANRRKELGYTQKEFADAIFYTPQAISKYETGLSEMDVSSLVPTCHFLELDADSLLRGIAEKKNDFCDTKYFSPELFARNLLYAREGLLLTRAQVGAAVGLSDRSILNYEKGKGFPSLTDFAKMSDLYQMNPSVILFEELPKPAKGISRRVKLAIALLSTLVAVIGAVVPTAIHLSKQQVPFELGKSSSFFSSITTSESSTSETSSVSDSSLTSTSSAIDSSL